MIKSLVIFVLGLAVIHTAFLPQSFTSTQDDDSISQVQQLFNGFWAAGGLDEPTGLAAKCFDENTAALVITAMNETMAYLVVNNIVKAIQTVSKFYRQVPPSLNDCMNNDSHVQEMYQAYGVVNMTVAQLNQRVLTYVLSHLEKVHGEIVVLNNDFQAENYYQVGQDGGKFALDVFNSSSLAYY